MALGAHAFVAFGVGAEVIDEYLLTQLLPGNGVGIFPGPVFVLGELVTRLVVTFEAGFGDFGAAVKWAFQFFQFGMVCGRFVCFLIGGFMQLGITQIAGPGVFSDTRFGLVIRVLSRQYSGEQDY